MDGKKQVFFQPTAEDLNKVSERNVKSLYQRILDKLVAKIDRAITPEFTVAMLKNYRTVPNSKVVIASVKQLKTAANLNPKYKVDFLGLDDMDFIIAEYNEQADTIIKTEVINPDSKIRSLVDSNNGVVIIED